MNDEQWRDLPPGDELDRYIAEQLGYKVERLTVPGTNIEAMGLFKPDGEFSGIAVSLQCTSVELATQLAFIEAGKFSRDNQAALSLPLPDEFKIMRWGGSWKAQAPRSMGAISASFANAVASAWLLWKAWRV